MHLPDIGFLQAKTRAALLETEPVGIREKLQEILAFYEIVNFDMGYDWPIWRARITTSDEGYSNIRELHYPPREVASAGRMNAPGEPLLYASLNKFSTLAEIHANEGDYVHLVGFTLHPERHLKCAIVGEVFNVHRSGRATLSDHLTNELNRILTNSDHRAARSWILIDAFFANIFADPQAGDDQYRHARTAAELIFDKQSDVNAIWYPGVALQNGVNLAIRPTAADSLLSVYASYVIRINKIFDYGIYDFSLVRHSGEFDDDGRIKWESGG